MTRKGWIAALGASILLMAGGGAGIIAASGSDDVGSMQVVELPVRDDAGVAETSASPKASSPEVTRRPAGVGTLQAQEAVVPSRLRVPSVELDAPLDPVGVRDDGLMEIPDDGSRAGWYEHGPTPGDAEGSAVLAGHVDTQEGLGAMAALRDVDLGARVEVGLDDGSTVIYEVVGRETIEKSELPAAELFDRAGPERLTLVTCGGPWRSEASSYRDNVVVVALPVGR